MNFYWTGLDRASRTMMQRSEGEMAQPHGSKASMRALRVASLAALIVPVAACSSSDSFNPLNLFSGEKYETKIVPDVPAEELYNQGLAKLDKKDYDGAAKKFADLDKQYPYSQWQRKGLLMTTFSQYQNGSYDDAIASAQRYIGLYPTSPDVAYAYYLAGMSNYNQIPDISRDQARAAKAAANFTQIIEKFPKSEYADDARVKLQVARDQLAGKEMLVGRYYLEEHNYPAAINRFREVLAKYQTTRHAEEALMRLTEAYLALGITNEAQTAAAVLGHNFPDSVWYKDAHARLQSGGLEPHEDKESWISKAFRKFGLG
jgi:outer membrane protein assembly factor BamD